MSKNLVKQVLEHPDKDELISKLITGFKEADIYEWLKAKYNKVEEAEMVFSAKQLKIFKENYLDIYQMMQDDIQKTKDSLQANTIDELQLSVKNNSIYKSKMIAMATERLDVNRMLCNMILAVEARSAQIFDLIQENPENMRNDRISMEWFDRLGAMLDRYYKYVEQRPDQVTQVNVSHKIIDDYAIIYQDTIKDVLSEMDIELSNKFVQKLNDKMNKLKFGKQQTNITKDLTLVEAKNLSDEVTKKLSE